MKNIIKIYTKLWTTNCVNFALILSKNPAFLPKSHAFLEYAPSVFFAELNCRVIQLGSNLVGDTRYDPAHSGKTKLS